MVSPPAEAPAQERHRRLVELALLFLRIGVTAFGGPAAHIAVMDREIVQRRKWLSKEEFVDLLGMTNLIPGPNSTELAIHIGHRRAGGLGLVVAGLAFILPAALIVGVLAAAYVQFGRLPNVAAAFYTIKPVMLAVVVQALVGLGRTTVKTWPLAGLAVVDLAASFLGFHELAVLGASGIVVAAAAWLRARRAPDLVRGVLPLWTGLLTTSVVTSTALPVATVGGLFFTFLKMGSVLFGSGYVLLAFLRADLVERLHWLSEQQLLDAVAVGQFTPGPVFTTATFVGYLIDGSRGALVSTLGIFLPAFVFVALSVPLVPRIRRSAVAAGFLDGVNVASLALMAVVSWQLGRAALVDGLTVALAGIAVIVLLATRVSTVWLILAAAALGPLANLLR